MHISQINATSGLTPKSTQRNAVSRLIHNIGANRRRRQMARIDKNMQTITKLYLKGNPEIAAKVNAVNEYVMKTDFSAPKISKEYEPHGLFCLDDMSYEYFIGKCTDVNEIYNQFGSYGLIAYAGNSISDNARTKLLPKSNDYKISESIVASDKPISLIFTEYLDSNNYGHMSDLYQRFGQIGKELFDKYRSIGFIDNGADANWKETYNVTNRFRDIEASFIPLRENNYLAGTCKMN